jgi:hypothetical protein
MPGKTILSRIRQLNFEPTGINNILSQPSAGRSGLPEPGDTEVKNSVLTDLKFGTFQTKTATDSEINIKIFFKLNPHR